MFGDCKGAFTAREMEDDDDYSSGDTFFLPASAERPKSKLEQIRYDIFEYHTKDVSYDPEYLAPSGGLSLLILAMVVLVLPGQGLWHGRARCLYFSHIATVTICHVEIAAPTIVLEKTSPPMFEASVEGKAGKNVYVSWPKQESILRLR